MGGRRTHEKKLTDCKTAGFLCYGSESRRQKNYGRETMFLSGGFIWRQGQRIKDFGERIGHVQVLGIHFLNWLAGLVISLGYKIRDSVRDIPVSSM
jgi:hypothetical protein